MDSSRDSRGIECQSRLAPRIAPGRRESKMHSTTIAVDLAKSVFEVAVSPRPGKVSARRGWYPGARQNHAQCRVHSEGTET